MDSSRLLALPLAAAALASCAQKEQEKSQPNILFIMTDDHTTQAMSCYGGRLIETPNMDRLAREGMRFENCYATNALSGPSRACILTGKFSHENGFTDNASRFNGDQQTFPKLLQSAGYETAMIGKWHLISEPQGFDFWSVLSGQEEQGDYYNPGFWEPENLFDDYSGRCPAAAEQDMSLEKTFTEDWDLKLMTREEMLANPDNRLSKVYFRMPEEAQHKWDSVYAGRIAEYRSGCLKGQELVRWKYQQYMRDYLATVLSVDESIGRVLDYLEMTGELDNTIVVYTSDQGFFLGEHGWFDKRFMYEECQRMPLLVRYPKAIKAGTVSDALCMNVDFAPTFLDYAGVEIPSDIQGVSLRPVIENDGATPTDWREAVYYHYYEYPAEHSVKRHYGIRTKDFKLIHFYNDIDCWELYDETKDPMEMHNVYDDPEYSETREYMLSLIDSVQKSYGDVDPCERERVLFKGDRRYIQRR